VPSSAAGLIGDPPSFCAKMAGVSVLQAGVRMLVACVNKPAISSSVPMRCGSPIPRSLSSPYIGAQVKRPETTNISEPLWELAHTFDGFVRFESKQHPGKVLIIHNNRRRRSGLLQAQVQISHASSTDDWDEGSDLSSGPGSLVDIISTQRDFWPVLKDMQHASPLESAFLVHHTPDRRGLEIWDPMLNCAIASIAKADNGPLHDEEGVTNCMPPDSWEWHEWRGSSDGCKTREYVTFQPALPRTAVSDEPRMKINEVPNWYWWQAVLVVVILLGFLQFLFGCALWVCLLLWLLFDYARRLTLPPTIDAAPPAIEHQTPVAPS